MKYYNTIKHVTGSLCLAVSIGFAGIVAAQEPLIAIGNVSSGGNLDSSANPLGAVVSVIDQGTGNHDVVIDAVGAFTGAVADDFTVEVGIERSNVVNDRGITANVISVTNDQLVVTVRTQDLEDTGSPSSALAIDEDFFFVIRRINGASISGDSRHLLALGRVSSTGTLLSGFGVEQVAVSSVRDNTGEFTVTLQKTGGFVGDNTQDYYFFGTVIANSDQDQIIHGDAINPASDDSIAFKIRTSDVQANPDGDLPTAENDDFWFTIYRADADSSAGVPGSRLISAMAVVDGAGNLDQGGSSIPGGIVSSLRTGPGKYQVNLVRSGAFAGRSANEFVVQASIRAGLTDRQLNGSVSIVNDNQIRVNITVNDLENSGNAQGDEEDNAFHLILFDTDPKLQPDLRIGTKKNLSQMKGDDKYNTSGAGQGIRIKLPGTSNKRYFFAMQNDGNSIDSFGLKEQGAGSILRGKYFRLFGGRSNVTALVRTNGIVLTSLRPGVSAKFEGQVKYRRASKIRNKKMKILGRSALDSAMRDAVKVKAVPNN